MAAALPRAKGEPGVTLHDGSRVSDAAWDLHQDFKWQLVATMDRDGATLAGVVIEAWIVAHRSTRDALPEPT